MNILAKSATLCARQKKAICFSVYKSGRHRSVAACVCLQHMFRKYISPSASIKVQHLESDAWAESPSAGKCNVCVAPLPQDVCAKLDEIWAMLPFRQDVPEVRRVKTPTYGRKKTGMCRCFPLSKKCSSGVAALDPRCLARDISYFGHSRLIA